MYYDSSSESQISIERSPPKTDGYENLNSESSSSIEMFTKYQVKNKNLKKQLEAELMESQKREKKVQFKDLTPSPGMMTSYYHTTSESECHKFKETYSKYMADRLENSSTD